MNKMEMYELKTFDDIKHIDENGIEYWLARELMQILQYSNWQNFKNIIKKSMISCEHSKNLIEEHFIEVNKVLIVGNNEKINKEDLANKAHNKIGKIVRNAIKEAGGTMPEDLPTPKKSLKELEKEIKSLEK